MTKPSIEEHSHNYDHQTYFDGKIQNICECGEIEKSCGAAKPSIEEWEKEFDEKFLLDDADYELMKKCGVMQGKEQIYIIKIFIRSLLTQSRQEVIEEVLACAPKKRDRLIYHKENKRWFDENTVDGYNYAIDDFIQSIKKIQ